MTRRSSGGRGGHANVDGDDSTAEGGQGGDAVVGSGGRGGDASVQGDNAHAIGGRGGRGGIVPGGAGGDARVVRDQKQILEQLDKTERDGIAEPSGRGGSAFAIAIEGLGSVTVAGGQGGEASQHDGRGGRGGRAHISAETRQFLGMPDPGHMRWPYFEPVTEPGRGGDAADTPQYMARRMIVEKLKRRYFRARGLPLTDVWWDRSVVPMDWLNEQLRTDGNRWAASIVDDEYEFRDRPKSEL